MSSSPAVGQRIRTESMQRLMREDAQLPKPKEEEGGAGLSGPGSGTKQNGPGQGVADSAESQHHHHLLLLPFAFRKERRVEERRSRKPDNVTSSPYHKL